MVMDDPCPAGYVSAANDPSYCCPEGFPYAGPEDLCYTTGDLAIAYQSCYEFGLDSGDTDGLLNIVVAGVEDGMSRLDLITENQAACQNLCSSPACDSECFACLNAVVIAILGLP